MLVSFRGRDDLFSSTPTSENPPETPGVEKSLRHQPLPPGCARAPSTNTPGNSASSPPGQLLRCAIEADRIQSLIFYGPPARENRARRSSRGRPKVSERLSGVESNVDDMPRACLRAEPPENTGQPTILFIDEIHRFNKSQQDILLPTSRAV